MKKTTWFSVAIAPVYIGLYEVRYTEARPLYMRYWNGSYWGINEAHPEFKAAFGEGAAGERVWRGLAQPK